MVYADLHVHTAYSDGIHSIEETIKLAKEKGIKVIAITDHDTVFHFEEEKLSVSHLQRPPGEVVRLRCQRVVPLPGYPDHGRFAAGFYLVERGQVEIVGEHRDDHGAGQRKRVGYFPQSVHVAVAHDTLFDDIDVGVYLAAHDQYFVPFQVKFLRRFQKSVHDFARQRIVALLQQKFFYSIHYICTGIFLRFTKIIKKSYLQLRDEKSGAGAPGFRRIALSLPKNIPL